MYIIDWDSDPLWTYARYIVMGKSQIKTYMPNTESCIQMELNPNLYISNHVPKFQFFLAQVLNLESPIFHYFEHLIHVKTSQWLYHHSIYTNDTTTSWDRNTHTICAMGALENFSFSIVSIRNSRDTTVSVYVLRFANRHNLQVES